MDNQLLFGLENKTLTKGMLLQKVEHDLDLISILVEGMFSKKPAIRYGCGKVLMDLSEKYPEEIYQNIESLVELLDSNSRIITWNSMAIIANVAKMDNEKK